MPVTMLRILLIEVCFAFVVIPLGAQGTDDRWGCEAEWSEWGALDKQHFGWDVASGGDWNGDGYDDFLISSLSTPGNPVADRRVALHLGGSSGPGGGLGDACLVITGIDAANRGPSVTFIGDVNDDGRDDFAIGAPGESFGSGVSRLGAVFVFFSKTHPCPTTLTLGDADAIIEGTTLDGSFGYSVGAVDGFFGPADGTSLLVGAPGPPDVDTGVLPGTVFLFSKGTLVQFAQAKIQGQTQCGGCPGVWFTSSDVHADWTASGSAAADHFGHAVAGVGDVDGDGFGDLVVGAIQARHQAGLAYDTRLSDPGYATLYRGPTGSPVTLDGIPASGFHTLLFGHSVAGGIDINDDTRPDILVGAPYYVENGTTDYQGAVFAFSVDAGGLTRPAYGPGNQPVTFDITGVDPELTSMAVFGWDVAMLGDVNDDDFGDWIAGAPGHWEAAVDPAPAPCDPSADNAQGGRISGRVLVVNGGNQFASWPPSVLGRYRGEGNDKGRMGTTVAAGSSTTAREASLRCGM